MTASTDSPVPVCRMPKVNARDGTLSIRLDAMALPNTIPTSTTASVIVYV